MFSKFSPPGAHEIFQRNFTQSYDSLGQSSTSLLSTTLPWLQRENPAIRFLMRPHLLYLDGGHLNFIRGIRTFCRPFSNTVNAMTRVIKNSKKSVELAQISDCEKGISEEDQVGDDEQHAG